MSDFQIMSGQVGLYALLPGDELQVFNGGESLGSIVGAAAREYVEKGGKSYGDHVLSGGLLVLSSGASASGDTIGVGGVLSGPGRIEDDAHDYGTVVGASVKADTGATKPDVLYVAGNALGVLVGSGGVADVFGASKQDHVYSGGVEEVHSGGVSSLARVAAGGSLLLEAHGLAEGTTLGAGATEHAAAGSVQRSASVEAGGSLLGSGSLRGVITDAGLVSGGTVNLGELDVRSGGVAEGVRVSDRGTLDIFAGGTAQDIAVSHAGALVDNGVLTETGTTHYSLAGALSGAGSIVEDGAGAVTEAGDASAFHGELVLGAGSISLAGPGLGHGSVAFEAATSVATLQLRGAGVPANGSTFADTLIDFDSTDGRLDLHSQAFVSGATAKVSGSTLTLVDGSYTARFELGGTHAASYGVVEDSAGGTEIRVKASKAASLIQAAASFNVSAPANTLTGTQKTADLFSAGLATSSALRPTHA